MDKMLDTINKDCQHIIFSDEAYNAIMTEADKMSPNETGGILLGHILDNGIWIVMEVLPPGWRSKFEYASFEYDEQFVNYVAQNESKKYEQELSLLGLWHRHPGSMDTFSNIDDGTNRTFAGLHSKGAISGLVNIDPRFRLTMYHCSNPLRYTKIEIAVGDDLIPQEYFKWRYYDGEELNPYLSEKKNDWKNTEKQYEVGSERNSNQKNGSVISDIMKVFNSKILFFLLFLLGIIFSIFSYYSYSKLKDTDSIKTLYRIYYSEQKNGTPSTDSVNKSAAIEFEKNQISIRETLDYNELLFAENKKEYINFIKGIVKEDSIQLLTQQFKDSLFANDATNLGVSIGKFLEKNKIAENANYEKLVDSLKEVYKAPLLNAELKRLKDEYVKNAIDEFLLKTSAEINTDDATIKIKLIVILLVITTLLSLLLAFFPRKHSQNMEWLIIGASFIISAIIANLFYPLSPSFIIILFFIFVFLCLVVFMTLCIIKTYTHIKTKNTQFWFQRNPQLYIEEETLIKNRFRNIEKNVENGTLSFFISTDKQIDNQPENLSFQIVYSVDYDKTKEIKIYLVTPDLSDLLGETIKEFPYIAIDSAGECYLDLCKVINKNQVRGMEVIRNLDKWLQLYSLWLKKEIDIKDIKL